MSGSTCSVIPVASEAEFDKQISSLSADGLAVIYFHAPWAEPCKQMSTVLSTLASTYTTTEPPKISFLSLDAEEVADISEKYDVSQVPLVVLEQNGKVVDSVTGTDASKLRNAVERYAGRSGAAATTNTNGLPPAQKVSRPQPSETTEQADAGHDANGVKSSGDSATAPLADNEQGMSQEELHARLSELVKAAPVMLFMKGTPSAPQCGFSRQTVSLLREKGVRYGFFNILADDEVRQGLKEYSDWPTFPQLYVDGELVGGLDIVKEEFESDVDFLKQYSVNASSAAAA